MHVVEQAVVQPPLTQLELHIPEQSVTQPAVHVPTQKFLHTEVQLAAQPLEQENIKNATTTNL